MKLIDAVNGSIDRVMAFYERRGVGFAKRPTFQYVNGYGEDKYTIAETKGDKEARVEIGKFQTEHFSRILYEEWLGLNVSDSALKESVNVLVNRRKDSEIESKTDIFLYIPAKTVVQMLPTLDTIMAHELWHLKEHQMGVLIDTPFLGEGTATYAMVRFNGGKVQGNMEQLNNLFHLFYVAGALLTERELGDSVNPYPLMLGQGFRVPIHAELLGIAQKKARELSRKTLKDPHYRKILAQSSKKVPEFNSIAGNLSHESIIQAYRNVGAVKLAEELDSQDLGKLIEWFKFGGF